MSTRKKKVPAHVAAALASMKSLPPDATCTCGDVLDEHRNGSECTVEGCDCCHFEHDADADKP